MSHSQHRIVRYPWANFEGSNGETAFILLDLLYEQDNYYPFAAHFTAPHGLARVSITMANGQARMPDVQQEKINFEVGMTGEILFTSKEGELPEKWFVAIISIESESIIAGVVKPPNFPICPARNSIALDPVLRSNAPGIHELEAPWTEMTTFSGLSIQQDLEVDSALSIIRLTIPDLIEMGEWIRARLGSFLARYQPPTHAICRRQYDSRGSAPLRRIVEAISLFKKGHIETEYGFRFSTSQGRGKEINASEGLGKDLGFQFAISYSVNRSYRWEAPQLTVSEDEVLM